MTDPVYCMFCVHCKYPAPSGLPEACRHPSAPRDPVTARLPMCISMRQFKGLCGPTGKLYEKRSAPEAVPEKKGIFVRIFGRRK